jgi:hypothetical protein
VRQQFPVVPLLRNVFITDTEGQSRERHSVNKRAYRYQDILFDFSVSSMSDFIQWSSRGTELRVPVCYKSVALVMCTIRYSNRTMNDSTGYFEIRFLCPLM